MGKCECGLLGPPHTFYFNAFTKPNYMWYDYVSCTQKIWDSLLLCVIKTYNAY